MKNAKTKIILIHRSQFNNSQYRSYSHQVTSDHSVFTQMVSAFRHPNIHFGVIADSAVQIASGPAWNRRPPSVVDDTQSCGVENPGRRSRRNTARARGTFDEILRPGEACASKPHVSRGESHRARIPASVRARNLPSAFAPPGDDIKIHTPVTSNSGHKEFALRRRRRQRRLPVTADLRVERHVRGNLGEYAIFKFANTLRWSLSFIDGDPLCSCHRQWQWQPN